MKELLGASNWDGAVVGTVIGDNQVQSITMKWWLGEGRRQYN